MMRKSGNVNGLQEAINALSESIKINPEDLTAVHALADSHYKLKQYSPALRLLQPIKGKGSLKDQEYILVTLINCYRGINDHVKATILSHELENLRRRKS